MGKKPFSSLTALGMLPETLPAQKVAKEAAADRARDELVRPRRTIAGRYLLEERLAKGGMSTLWTAIDNRLGREVIVKRARPRKLARSPRLTPATLARARFPTASPGLVAYFGIG